jgi:hypothetical protein
MVCEGTIQSEIPPSARNTSFYRSGAKTRAAQIAAHAGAKHGSAAPLRKAYEAVKKLILRILALCVFNSLHCG